MSEPRPFSPLPAALLILTFTTGLVDAVSFLGLGRVFTANMTGNVVFVAFSLAGIAELSAARSLVSLAAFVVGAIIGGRLARSERLREASHRHWLIRAAMLEIACLVLAITSAIGYDYQLETPTFSLYGIIIATALAMGFRNATVLRIAEPDLKTTVLTLTVTGIAADSSLAGGDNPRFGRRILAVLALFAGAGVGAWMLQLFGAVAPLILMAALVFGATALYIVHPASVSAKQGKK